MISLVFEDRLGSVSGRCGSRAAGGAILQIAVIRSMNPRVLAVLSFSFFHPKACEGIRRKQE